MSMEVPSSPPALPVVASQLEATSSDLNLPPTRSCSQRVSLTKKRRRDDASYSNSSDPPVFSSDAFDASLEDYTGQRKKRTLIGPWWNPARAERTARQPKQREFKRNFDSGVFMGSESSDCTSLSSDSFQPDNLPFTQSTSSNLSVRRGLEKQSDSQLRSKPATISGISSSQLEDEGLCLDSTSTRLSEAYAHAQAIVDECIETGNPFVDLSKIGFEELSPDIVRSLQYITNQTTNKTQPEPEEYDSLTPDLMLFLASNNLLQLPGELCRITNLTSLSLRNNNLKSLPPQIGHLPHLLNLNLSINDLRYLPYSLLQRKLDRANILLHGIDFLKPIPNDQHEQLPSSLSPRDANQCRLAAVSTVCFFDVDGRPLNDEKNPPIEVSLTQLQPETHIETGAQNFPREETEYQTDPPSLMALALKHIDAAGIVVEVEQLRQEGCDHDIPPRMVDLLSAAAHAKAAGDLKCDECGRCYSLPRAEWLEWWTGVADEKQVPFLKKVCGWSCVKFGEQGGERSALKDVLGAEENDTCLAGVVWGCGWSADIVADVGVKKDNNVDR